MPVSEVKIDRYFVQNMFTDKENTSIVQALVLLGHSLNLTVVAEGVEDAETTEILRRSNCDLIQGFYFARPMAADALEGWLLDRSYAASRPRAPIIIA
jgi:EAL domain-containing protein (putative c-di-GMP-specific phosphodiesterase class I)